MKRKHTTRVNAIAFAQLVLALIDGEYTTREMVDFTGLTIGTVRKYINALHKAHAVYISGWDQDDCGRYRAAQYTIGNEVDKLRPKPASQKQKSARWRAKLKNINLIQRTAA